MITRTRVSRWRGSSENSPPLLVDFSAVADAEDEHNKPSVFEGTDQAIIAYAVFPKPAQCTLKSCSELTRVVQFLDALAEKIQNSSCDRFVEFAQLFQRSW